MNLKDYRKFLVAALIPIAIAAVEAIRAALTDNEWSGTDTSSVIAAVVGAIGVLLVRNGSKPHGGREGRAVRDGRGRFAPDRDGDGVADGSLR